MPALHGTGAKAAPHAKRLEAAPHPTGAKAAPHPNRGEVGSHRRSGSSRIGTTAALGALLLLGAEVARAQDTPPGEPADGARFRSVVEESVIDGQGAGARQELDAAALRASGATSLAEALAGQPGLLVSRSPVSGSANAKQESLLTLRGFDASEVLVLVDGAPVADPDSGLVDLARHGLAGVQRIIVTRGVSSLLYGPGALAGVVHLVSGSQCGGAAWCAEAGATGRASGTEPLGGRLSGAAGASGARGSGQLAGSYARATGYPVPAEFVPQRNEAGGLRDNADALDLVLRGRAQWDAGPVALQAGASFVDHSGGVPCSVADPAPANLWRRAWRRQSVDLGARTDRLGPLEARGRVYLARQLDTLTSYTDPGFDTVLDGGRAVSTHDGLRLGLFLAPRLVLPSLRTDVTFGYHHQLDRVARQDERGGPTSDFGSETLSLASELRVRPRPGWALFGGASVVGFFKEQAGGGTSGEDLRDLEWLAGSTWSPAAGWLLRLGASRRVGFPTLKRLYGTFGNPDLRPEQGLLLDAGLERLPWGPWQLGGELSLFHSRVEDLVGQGGTLNELHYVNVARARLQGAELTVQARPLPWASATLGYAWLDARDDSAGGELVTLDFRPAHQASARGTLGLWQGGQLTLGYEVVTARRYRLEEAGPTSRTAELPWYGLVDGALTQQLALGPQGTLEAALRCQNCADTYHEDAPGRPSPGRTLMIELTGRR